MLDEEELDDLLVKWGESREQGQELSIEELCADCPELAAEMTERINDVKAVRRYIEFDDDADDDFISLPDFSTIANRADETVLPACSLSVDEFDQAIAKSGLVDADQLQKFRDSHPSRDARSLASQLVASKKLTHFQATVLLAGRRQPLVLDRYIILAEIGAGGMGAVFKALHQQMDRVVALKILPQSSVDSPDKVKRFHREVRAAAKLEHPNIVTAFDAHESKGVHFLVMSYVKGSDLAKTVRTQGPLSVAKAVNYIIQAATGLAHAHEQGICHRDVKPANLLLDKKGTVKILDMGLARIDDAEPENDNTVSQELTQAGAVMGTIAFIAPEQAIDTHDADARSDIYSLGCTLYYLLIGKPVYTESTMMKTIMAHRERQIPSLCDERHDVPDELDAIYRRMVAKCPGDRYQSMSQVISALEALDMKNDEPEVVEQVVGSQTLLETEIYIDTSRDAVEHQLAVNQVPFRRWGWIAACLLVVAGLGGMWAASIFLKVETSEGTIVVEINQPELAGAVVSVDGQEKVTLTTEEGAVPIEVVADKKTHTLNVTKGGFQTFTKKFTVKAGGKQTIQVRLEPVRENEVSDGPSTDRQVAEWILSIGGIIHINHSNNAKVAVSQVAKLPQDAFHIVQVNLDRTAVSDDQLANLNGLAYLRGLSVGDTQISDAGLVHLKEMTELTALILGDTRVTDAGLRHIAAMTKLQILVLVGTEVSSAGLEQIQAMNELQKLYLADTGIGDAGIAHLKGLTKLWDLQLRNTQVGSAGLEQLAGLTNMAHLDLDGTKVSDTGLGHLASLTKLTHLELKQTQIGDAGLEQLSGMPQLKVLELNDSPVTDVGLAHLKRLTHLASLQVTGTKVTANGVADLQKALPNCKIQWDGNTDPDRTAAEWVLEIGGTAKTDAEELTDIEKLPQEPFHIVVVDLYNKRKVVGDNLQHLKGLTELTTLNLMYTQVSDTGLEHLKGLTNLNQLSLGFTQVSDAGVVHLKDLTKLEILNLHGTQVGDVGLRHLKGLTNLRHLELSRTLVGDTGLQDLAQLPKLRLLTFMETKISDAGLKHLKGLTNLVMLDLTETQVSDAGLKDLAGLTKLTTLRLLKTKVTAQGVADLQKSLPNCEITGP